MNPRTARFPSNEPKRDPNFDNHPKPSTLNRRVQMLWRSTVRGAELSKLKLRRL